MLAGPDGDGNLLIADQVVRHADIVEIVNFDHEVVEHLARVGDAEGDGVVALVAMHEADQHGIFAHADFVLDAAAHPERMIELLRCDGILLADDAMPEAAGSGLEAAMHRTPGVKRLMELDCRPVENLDRIAARICQLQ